MTTPKPSDMPGATLPHGYGGRLAAAVAMTRDDVFFPEPPAQPLRPAADLAAAAAAFLEPEPTANPLRLATAPAGAVEPPRGLPEVQAIVNARARSHATHTLADALEVATKLLRLSNHGALTASERDRVHVLAGSVLARVHQAVEPHSTT